MHMQIPSFSMQPCSPIVFTLLISYVCVFRPFFPLGILLSSAHAEYILPGCKVAHATLGTPIPIDQGSLFDNQATSADAVTLS
jgi:hypothetical protein